MRPFKKPILGVTPRFIVDLARIQELTDCIAEHINAGQKVPERYAEEFLDRIKSYNKGLEEISREETKRTGHL